MSLSPAFLDELRSRTLLSALVGKSVKLQRAGREWKACCPFHNEKSPSFYVNDDKGFYHCFGCSAHGDAIRWLTEQQGLTFIDAVKELAANAGMEMPASDPRSTERAERADGLHEVMAASELWFAEQLAGIEGAEARSYLSKRGVTAELVKAFGLGFAPDNRGKLKAALARFGNDALVEAGLLISVEEKEPYDRFRGRLMIPIRDARGRCIAFGGRILGTGEPKYLNSPDTPLFDKGRTLWNLDRAGPAARKANRLIVVEGYMDAIALAGAGIDEVVAPLGTALTEAQIDRMWRLVDVPILCFDGDSPGQKAAIRAANRVLPVLKPGTSLEFITLPRGQDPDDLIRRGGVKAMRQLLALPESLVMKLWHDEVEAGPLDTPEQKAGLRSRLDKLAGSIADPLVSSEYAKHFKNLFFKHFGFKREQYGFKKEQIDGVRAAMAGARAKGRASIDDTIIRAILLGLSRYSDVLIAEQEAVKMLRIDNKYLASWRDILAEAAFERPELDEDLIDTILHESEVSPVEKRNLRRDLAFSFFKRGNDRARRDLKEVIDVCIAEREIREGLARAEARFKASQESTDWELQRTLALEASMMAEKRKDWATLLSEAA